VKVLSYPKLLFLLFVANALTACTSVDVNSYSENRPEIDVRNFFSGPLIAHGIVKNRKGVVTRTFVADIEASWDSKGIGTLDESFIFDDGGIQSRIWTLSPSDDGQYVGTANDVLGDSKLKVSGNALFLKYKLQVPYSGRVISINVDDRMYLIDEDTLLNESRLTKFGFHVGDLQLVISKVR